MGYDLRRFSSKIDDKLLCAICASVIENPVQTPCEHLFCKECIKDWLFVNSSCPVDNRPITSTDLSDTNRVLRNLLNKFEIDCDFQQDGCQTTIKLEYLEQHVKNCVCNLDGEVVCDKGCNMTMKRREYLKDSCFSHLAYEIRKMRYELCEQKCYFERSIDRQMEEIKYLHDEINRGKNHAENSNSQEGAERELRNINFDHLPFRHTP